MMYHVRNLLIASIRAQSSRRLAVCLNRGEEACRLQRQPSLGLCLSSVANFSSQSLEQKSKFVHFRCEEADPTKHNELHEGLFYVVPKEEATKLYSLGGWDKEQHLMFKTFREEAIMIRKPSMEIINYLNKTDFQRPPNRYVLYGPIGSGKTFTLNHILHYGYTNKFVLIHCHKPTDWTRFPQEHAVSSYNPKRLDTPLDAAVWLQHFKALNAELVDELNLTSLNDYTWSQRELTKKGDPLMSIVEHGINRIKHASDCMAVLLKELKLNSAQNPNCRLLVVGDKVNAFYEESLLRFPDRLIATPDDITIARAFKKMFKKDWQNGAVVASVDKKLVVPYRILKLTGPTKDKAPAPKLYKHYGPFKVDHLSDYPKDLLTDVGFQDFDPFIPVEVCKYSDKEVNSCLDYYEDRDWLQRPEARTEVGRDEIRFLSGNNPFQVYEFCTNL